MEALAFLRRATPYAHAPRPDVILLDLNLPRKNGREVLDEIKADATLRCIPVVVLTTSNAPQDIQAAYAGHANAYLTKPLDLDQFFALMASFSQFWLTAARLPLA